MFLDCECIDILMFSCVNNLEYMKILSFSNSYWKITINLEQLRRKLNGFKVKLTKNFPIFYEKIVY